MRILFLNHNVVRKGGTFFRAYHLARHLVRRGHDVTLVSISEHRTRGFEEEESQGVKIVHSPDLLRGVGRTGWDPYDTCARMMYLRPERWDIVHAWDCRPAVIFPALYARSRSAASRGRLVIDWCDWWGRGGTQAERPGRLARAIYGPVETFFEERFRTRADATTVASHALAERAVALGVPRSTVTLLPGGSDTDAVKPMDRADARQRLTLDNQDWIVGYLGVLPASEVDLLLEALRLARVSIPTLRFLAIGVAIAGSGLSLRQAAGDRWSSWMTETGRIPFDHVGVHLSACNAVVLPMRNNTSNRARWPSKINDYLSAGCPIVATRVGEIEPLLAQGVGMGTSDDPRSLADGLLFAHQHPETAAEWGRTGRALAEGDLNWAALTARICRVYEDVRGGGADLQAGAA